jgi:hypothetical protein
MDETDSKHPKIHRKVNTSIWILKISRKKSANLESKDFGQIFVISYEKSIGWVRIHKSIENL